MLYFKSSVETKQPVRLPKVRQGIGDWAFLLPSVCPALSFSTGGAATIALLGSSEGLGFLLSSSYGTGFAYRNMFPTLDFVKSNRCTILVMFRQLAAVSGRAVFRHGNYSTIGHGFTDSAGRINGFGVTSAAISSPGRAVGRFYTTLITYTGTEARLFEAGRLVGTTATTGSFTSNPDLFSFGNEPGFSFGAEVSVLGAAVSDSSVSDVTAQELSTSLWRMFRRPGRFIPQQAPAAVPTLSLPTFVPGSITSSGFRPRVTAG